ncbi:MAG: hypothetical protein A4E28_02064 [Methanocella sp. PtaU1.Bin125]|nr:MAG: hypothetical protein A4E28_02064 [Methanocella sp. PtaU1.Bin125]
MFGSRSPGIKTNEGIPMANEHYHTNDRGVRVTAGADERISSGEVFSDPYMDIVLVLALTAIAILSLFLSGAEYAFIRLPLAIAFFMFLPGYAFVAALFPGKDDIGLIARLSLSGGLSLVFSPLIGFALNYTVLGVRSLPLAAGIGSFIALCMIVTVLRRLLRPRSERFGIDIAAPIGIAREWLWPGDRKGSEKTVTIMLLISVLLVIATIALMAAMPIQHERYTEFYIYGSNGTIAEYPLNFVLGETRPVIAGIANHEGGPMAYDLLVTIDGTGDERQQLFAERIVVGDNQTLEKVINVTPGRTGDHMNLMFLLYADGERGTPYRACNLWVNVSQFSGDDLVIPV